MYLVYKEIFIIIFSPYIDYNYTLMAVMWIPVKNHKMNETITLDKLYLFQSVIDIKVIAVLVIKTLI